MTNVSTYKRVAVDQAYYWQRLETCPLGNKVQLLTEGGVAVYGTYSKGGGFKAWAPLPNKPEWLKRTD